MPTQSPLMQQLRNATDNYRQSKKMLHMLNRSSHRGGTWHSIAKSRCFSTMNARRHALAKAIQAVEGALLAKAVA